MTDRLDTIRSTIAGALAGRLIGQFDVAPEQALQQANDQLDALLAAYADSLRTTEPSVAWLVESPVAKHNPSPMWFAALGASGPQWTTDANKAKRYDTREAAEDQADALNSHQPGDYRATEHMWLERDVLDFERAFEAAPYLAHHRKGQVEDYNKALESQARLAVGLERQKIARAEEALALVGPRDSIEDMRLAINRAHTALTEGK